MKITSDEIIKAQAALTSSHIVNNDRYDSKFAGYISSFAASLTQSGLLATVIAYENTDSQAEKRPQVIAENTDSQAEKRPQVIAALKTMLDIESSKLAFYILEGNKADDSQFIAKVERAMVALKIALRLYKKVDKKDNQNTQNNAE